MKKNNSVKMDMKTANFMLIALVFMTCYFTSFPNLLAKMYFGKFPTINLWLLLMIKLLVSAILFKLQFTNICYNDIFGAVFSANISSSLFGFTAFTVMYKTFSFKQPLWGYLSEFYLVVIITFVIVNILDSVIMVDSDTVNARPAKLFMAVLCSNIIIFLIIAALISYNMDMLGRKQAKENERLRIEYLKEIEKYSNEIKKLN